LCAYITEIYRVLYSLNNITGVLSLQLFFFFLMINMGGVQCCRYHNHRDEGKRLQVKSGVEKAFKMLYFEYYTIINT